MLLVRLRMLYYCASPEFMVVRHIYTHDFRGEEVTCMHTTVANFIVSSTDDNAWCFTATHSALPYNFSERSRMSHHRDISGELS